MSPVLLTLAAAFAFPWTHHQAVRLLPDTLPTERATAAGGDLDGDGQVDLMFGTDDGLVGRPAGRLEAYHVGPAGLQRWLVIEGAPSLSVAPDTGLADLDCDGALDVVIPAEEARLPGSRYQGAVLVFYGPFAPGALRTRDADAALYDTAHPTFGSSLATGADLDGDGCDDVVVGGSGALQYLPIGRLRGLVDVASLAGVRRVTVPDNAFGQSPVDVVSELHDLDGDGLDELLVGAWPATGAYVVAGRPAADA
ncbi:MAG TPA: integrin alpha, partial [Myxococcota bacterium]|nr:integrin alpha [Myxococcota bacterium]